MGVFETKGLKFRVWDNEKKKMFYWKDITEGVVDDYLIDSTGRVYRIERTAYAIKKGDRMTEYKIDTSITPVIHAIAMPFIDNVNYSPLYSFDICKFKDIAFVVIKTKNPVKDILSDSAFIAVIAEDEEDFNKKSDGLYKYFHGMVSLSKKEKEKSLKFWNKVEVIGNIFENRDLLTKFTLDMLRYDIDIDWEMVYE